MSNCTAAPGKVAISPDILGPGILTGYGCLVVSTGLVMYDASKFDGPANAVACLVLAVAYGVGSVITVSRGDTDEDSADTLFASAMASYAIIFGSISTLAKRRAGIPTRTAIFYVACTATTPLCLIYALYKSKVSQRDIFYVLNLALLVILLVYLITVFIPFVLDDSSSVAEKLGQRRLHYVTALVLFLLSLAGMIVAGERLNLDLSCNWHDWSYGQVFNGAAGVAGLVATVIDGLVPDGQ